MADLIIILALLAILLGAGGYVLKARRAGQKCIGCPHAKDCGGACSCKEN